MRDVKRRKFISLGAGGETQGGRGLGEAEMAMGMAPGAQFEISIDGTPRTYRDVEAIRH